MITSTRLRYNCTWQEEEFTMGQTIPWVRLRPEMLDQSDLLLEYKKLYPSCTLKLVT